MTTYATGNPLGSKDPRDLYDNAENFDAAMNDRVNTTWNDRFGVSRKTWFGVEQQVNDFLIGTAFEPVPLIYVDGSELVVPSPSKLIQRDGNLYSVRLPANFPVTLSGNWAADELLLTVRSDQALRQQLRAPGGAGMIGYDPAETYPSDTVGYELQALRSARRIAISSFWPAGGGDDGTSACEAAIVAAGAGGEVFFDVPDFIITRTLVQLQSQKWYGRGGQRGTTIRKGADIDMIEVSTLGTITDINLEGVGATYTGKGFVVPSGFSQNLVRCRAVNMGGEPLYFAPNAGGGANVTAFEGYPLDTSLYAGIAIAGDTTPHPRFFRGIWLSGANFALGPGAGNGGSLTQFYVRDLRFDATSTLFHISNGRCATLGATTTIKGFDHSIDGVAFAGPVALDSAQGINLGPSCSVPTFTENPSNCQYNSVYVQRRTYTPTWTQTSATPSVGNGTLTGNYIRHGHQCMVEIELVAGSATSFGDSTSAYRFSLPFPGHLSFNQKRFPVRIYDSSAGADFTGWASIGAGQDYITIAVGAQQVRATSPMTWANGDTLECSFSYMTR
ncbi:TPA: hypothetical protein VDT58_001675 [Pseudomonas aeruginosa]|nr:hypothetical protein [Pseudomonas aeruginosa]HCI2709157.1 hypothetical protein [Pseudomonas aeruginosa]HCI4039689.1 hypothetical protein [Pseudomonas aeruginosa]HEP8212558.1 hypothetical protein [Pseudomonas aeruginosa]